VRVLQNVEPVIYGFPGIAPGTERLELTHDNGERVIMSSHELNQEL